MTVLSSGSQQLNQFTEGDSAPCAAHLLRSARIVSFKHIRMNVAKLLFASSNLCLPRKVEVYDSHVFVKTCNEVVATSTCGSQHIRPPRQWHHLLTRPFLSRVVYGKPKSVEAHQCAPPSLSFKPSIARVRTCRAERDAALRQNPDVSE